MSQKVIKIFELILLMTAGTFVLTTAIAAEKNADLTINHPTVNCFDQGQVLPMSVQQCVKLGGAYIKPVWMKDSLKSQPLTQLEQSALDNIAVAQYEIAEQYRLLGNSEQDAQQMIRWYRLAAQQAYVPALFSLGQVYESGEGLNKDILRANEYYQQAFIAQNAHSGHTESTNRHEYFAAISSLGQTAEQPFATQKQLQKKISQLELAKQDLLSLAASKKLWQQELKAIATGFAPMEFLQDRFTEANDELRRANQLYQTARQSLTQQQYDIDVLKNELTQPEDRAFSVAGVALLQSDLEQERAALEHEFAAIEAQQTQYQQLSAKRRSLPSGAPKTDERMAFATEGDKRAALNRYLEEQEESVQRRSATAKKRQKKLDFLERRIAKLKKDNQRKISADDAVLLQRALREMSHRYQGKVDYLSSSVEQQKNNVTRLSEQLNVADKVSKEKDQYIGAVKQELSKASRLVKKQSQLVTTQSKQLAEAIEQMKAMHPQQSLKKVPQQAPQPIPQPVLPQSSQQQTLTQAGAQGRDAGKRSLEPEIVIKWPQFRRQGDVYIAQAPAGSLLNVVGAAYSPTAIQTFMINDQLEELDRNGLFMKTIEISTEPVAVNLSMRSESDPQIDVQLIVEPVLTALDNTALAPLNVSVQADAVDNVSSVKDLDFGRYYALVVGNNDYNDLRLESLDTAVNDAEAVAHLLQNKYGFEVDLRTNISRDELLQALESMRKKLTEKDNLLVYYAGHGIVDPENDQGYWIPVDGSSTSTSRWVSNATITDQIRAMSARNVMVVADSCYSGSLMRSSVLAIRSGLSAEKKVLRFKSDIAATTRVVLSSGGIQPVADSIDNSPHSVFTGAMLKVLQDNVQLLDADSLATSVSHAVVMATKNNIKQVPRYAPLPRAGHEGGEFYFVPKEW